MFLLSCVCDSIATKLLERECQSPCGIHDASTNLADASITYILCCSVINVVFICVAGFLLWKLIDYFAKGIAGWRKRSWELEDRKLKLKSDLLDKKLEILKDLCYETKDKDAKKIIKGGDNQDILNYIKELNSVLILEQKEER
jgi:hypothetical protein